MENPNTDSDLAFEVDLSDFYDIDNASARNSFIRWLEVRLTLCSDPRNKQAGILLCDGYLRDLAPSALGSQGLGTLQRLAEGFVVPVPHWLRTTGLVAPGSHALTDLGRAALEVLSSV